MLAQTNLTTDISSLLKIPSKVLNELNNKACLCIGSAIFEAKKAGETQVTIGIGIGTLSVNLIDMQCKFIPSKELKTAIKNTLSSEVDPIELALEKTFIDKLLAACEEVL